MPPLPSIRCRLRSAALRLVIVAAAVAAACASAARRGRAEESAPAEVLVEVLPRGAELSVDGVPVGRGSRTVPIPDPNRRYAFRATAAGFEPVEHADVGSRLAGARIGLALRPTGWWAAVDLDDAPSLGDAALALLRDGRTEAALEYAQRGVNVAPRVAATHKLAAQVASSAGDRDRAIAEYGAYLALAADAPDRDEVAAVIETLRASTRAPGVEVRREAPAGGGTR